MIYDITHTTRYRFNAPVRFGQHRLLFRPRDGHDVRVLATSLEVTPQEQRVDLVHDAYGNSVALIQPPEQGEQLTFVSRFTVEHLGTLAFEMPAGPAADAYPPAYTNSERMAVQPYLLPNHEDPDNQVVGWTQQFFDAKGAPQLRPLLASMTQHIRDNFKYQARDVEGIQTPAETLALSSGSCRDFATLMIDALRRLGIAARFVSGYVHSPGVEGGHGATHAWVQAYVPECGWVPCDPTNNLTGGSDLIMVAVAREGKEVPPLTGSWFGEPRNYVGMDVEVSVVARGAPMVAAAPAPVEAVAPGAAPADAAPEPAAAPAATGAAAPEAAPAAPTPPVTA